MANRSEVTPRPGFGEREYRRLVRTDLHCARVAVQETDLGIYTDVPADRRARDAVYEQRGYLEAYIRNHPGFLDALTPWPDDPTAPPIVREMIQASASAGVGPMAAVAGAVAERVGRSLLQTASEVIVENGGDIYIAVRRPITIGVYAGDSPLSLKGGVRILPDSGISAVCTSSGTIGHSLSLGRADAVSVLSDSCALADAAATAVGNRIHKPDDIAPAIEWSQSIKGVDGILVIAGDKMGAWGRIEIVPL